MQNARARPAGTRVITGRGEQLAKEWGLPVAQARYHKDGAFFGLLEAFPAALLDPSGYVLFATPGGI